MSPTAPTFHIRRAAAEDIHALEVLIDLSVRGLQKHDYSQIQIEGALSTVFSVDTRLIADGTYFAFEAESPDGARTIVGCGGWSKRKTLYGGDRRPGRDDELLDPLRDSAKIRAFFVHPDWARRGIGSTILETCERAASEAGFLSFELGSTVTGVPLYRARGYRVVDHIEVPLVNGVTLPVIRMWKSAVG